MKKTLRLILPLIVLALPLGCAGIPKEIHQDADGIPKRIKSTGERIAVKQKDYETFIASSDYDEFKIYAEREKWSENFVTALQKVGEASSVFKTTLKPMLEKNERDKEQQARVTLGRINSLLRDAIELSDIPGVRRTFIVETKAKAPELIQEAGIRAKTLAAVTASLRDSVAQARVDYPAKKDDLTNRLAMFEKLNREGQQWHDEAIVQFKRPGPDYAIIGDNCAKLQQRLEECQSKNQEIMSQSDNSFQSDRPTVTK